MSVPHLPRPLLARLYNDLAELLDSPYPGVVVFTDDADIRKLCLILTPPSGPWKDLSLHFDVELPYNWPAVPPKIRSSVDGIAHPNLFGSYICCDLLKGHNELQRGYTGGYTPALTLRGLFLQFLTFFSSTKVEQDYDNDTVSIGDYIMTYYTTENSLAMSMFRAENCCLKRYPCTCPALVGEQQKLEAQWKTNPSAEVVLAVYQPGRESTTHSAKTISGGVRLHQFSRVNPRWQMTYDLISKWRCRRCSYGSTTHPVYRQVQEDAMDINKQVLPYLIPPTFCLLDMLNDDVLIELSCHLLSESVIAFSMAYSRFRRIVTATRVLLQREVRCFFLRTSLRDSILGIGIAFDPKRRTLSSDFDWLSKEAFHQYRIRISIQKREFGYFLPLALSRPHFERAEKDIWIHLQVLDKAVGDAEVALARRTGRVTTQQATPPRQSHQVVEVVYKMMNNIVVSLMKFCDDVLDTALRSHRTTQTLLLASEKAVISYCHLFYLLICLSRTTPAILRDATDRLRRFILAPESRTKTHVPDLGELIVLLTLVVARPSVNGTPVAWDVLNGPFLQEAVTRNVRWVLADLPELEVIESGASAYRLQMTFGKSRTSLRLIMFQIAFLDVFVKTYATNVAQLDDNYGFPEPEIPEKMVKEVKAIYKVDSWREFFERVQYTRGLTFGEEKMSELLRVAVRASAQRRYHVPKDARQLHLLSRDRELLEKKWMKARA